MNQEELHTIIEKQVKSSNIHTLMSEISMKEGFCQKIMLTYKPLQQLVILLLLYFCKRSNIIAHSGEHQSQVGQIQLRITQELKSYKFNFNQKQKTFDDYFTEKIVILSLILSHLMTSLNRKVSIELTNVEDYFISLIYLSTGKLISLKCFEFCKTRMRKRIINKVPNTYPSLKYLRKEESSKLKTTFYKSQISLFKEELRSILSPQNSHKTFCQKHFFIKLSSKRSNANPQKMKKKFTQLNLNIDLQSKQRSKTIISSTSKIKFRASVDEILENQVKSKKTDKNCGVRFGLQKQSFASGHSHKSSFNLEKSRVPLHIY